MSELANVMQRVPQELTSISLKRRLPLEDMPRLGQVVAATEKSLGRNGRVLVRWSGTEPKLRLMAEGPDATQLSQWLAEMIEAAQLDTA